MYRLPVEKERVAKWALCDEGRVLREKTRGSLEPSPDGPVSWWGARAACAEACGGLGQRKHEGERSRCPA